MTGDAESDDVSVLHAAVLFMAHQQGGADRTLAQHHRLPDGRCRGCLTSVTTWPCSVAALALLARQHPSYRK